jgi:hypothetical protein
MVGGEGRSAQGWGQDPGPVLEEDDEAVAAGETEAGTPWERMLEALEDDDERGDPVVEDGIDALRASIAERLGSRRWPSRRR